MKTSKYRFLHISNIYFTSAKLVEIIEHNTIAVNADDTQSTADRLGVYERSKISNATTPISHNIIKYSMFGPAMIAATSIGIMRRAIKNPNKI